MPKSSSSDFLEGEYKIAWAFDFLIYVLIISAIVDITLYISPLLTTILADPPAAPLSLAENSIPKARKLFKSSST